MRTPRLLILILFLVACLFLLCRFITVVSGLEPLVTNSVVPIKATPSTSSTNDASSPARSSRLRALFFNSGLSLFSPNAVISLTDDNSTSFPAQPAAFGPRLPAKGLSAQLWVGSTFTDDNLKEDQGEGELGCSDIPGWEDGRGSLLPSKIPGSRGVPPRHSANTERHLRRDPASDGTDDHIHNEVVSRRTDTDTLGASQEFAGKTVLLSRGGCGFYEKVLWAQRRGATALIVGDNQKGRPLIQMYARGDTSNVSIPSVFTSRTTAHLLASLTQPGSFAERITDDDGHSTLGVLQAAGLSKGGDKSGWMRGLGDNHSEKRPVNNPPIRHDGLWVTITPSTNGNPFFDTLLVLVISPLITLTIVYGLLLVRARIRRRRWRAPKSVIDRLPVRTYQTVSPSPLQTPRVPSPLSDSPTTPLLQETLAVSRPRSTTSTGVPEADRRLIKTLEPQTAGSTRRSEREKALGSISSEWKKYMSRQVECVVCLEEYIDGVSRVMSLPCGHEFHAECITPWLTTRRRTCPICKGDVVRSLARGSTSSPRYEPYRDDDSEDESESEGETEAEDEGEPSGSRLEDDDLEHGIYAPTPQRRLTRAEAWLGRLATNFGTTTPSGESSRQGRDR
ncbi:hypothetical protein SODALDRAFT_325211 [Sodiomyces alkalinus F11]|uniref:RING-type domain-containing protein n=1 Tax=Sodiomyces alkalinus (strain CBS 110278 / VKM F-3762 / F11) TaxID=1314773 RepID=A0A3N2PTK9_SODAK|nr:hypothetical protein SODALDRAFT_325211 [Sodiomyces alkalinus F11]ROT37656.1 hypothetical protein SODALDRAFT_325211 [Sodiomyces alkalinus F11]